MVKIKVTISIDKEKWENFRKHLSEHRKFYKGNISSKIEELIEREMKNKFW